MVPTIHWNTDIQYIQINLIPSTLVQSTAIQDSNPGRNTYKFNKASVFVKIVPVVDLALNEGSILSRAVVLGCILVCTGDHDIVYPL